MVVMPMAGRPSLFRSTLMLTGVGVASQFFGFLYRIAMARLAGAEVLGLYQLILPAYAVISPSASPALRWRSPYCLRSFTPAGIMPH